MEGEVIRGTSFNSLRPGWLHSWRNVSGSSLEGEAQKVDGDRGGGGREGAWFSG
jgi:hypothetical protein